MQEPWTGTTGILAVTMYYDWLAEVIDVEAAFLNNDVDEDISIETPQGLQEIVKDVHVFKLLNGMCIRNCSSTRCWSTTIVKYVISKAGMNESKIDPTYVMNLS